MGNKHGGTSERPKTIAGRVTDHWKIGEKLGQGAFGVVRVCTRKDDESPTFPRGMKAAVKVIDKSNLNEPEKRNLDRESRILEAVDHPKCVSLYEIYDTRKKLYLVMEICEGKELFDAITEQESPFTELQAQDVVRQVCQALVYLHDLNIVHRDLKPENILYADEARQVVKLMDFGLAKLLDSEDTMLKTRCGTLHYVAPEVLSSKAKDGYSAKCDVWSVGVILYVLLCGYLPFFHEDRTYTAKLIRRGKFIFDPEEWDVVSDNAKDLIRHMIEKDVSERYSAQQVLDHPWISASAGASAGEVAPGVKQKFAELNINRHMENIKTYHAMAMVSAQLNRWIQEAREATGIMGSEFGASPGVEYVETVMEQ